MLMWYPWSHDVGPRQLLHTVLLVQLLGQQLGQQLPVNQDQSRNVNPTDRSEPKRGHRRCLYQVKGRKMSQLFVKEKIFCQRGKGALREYTARSSSMSWHCRISDKKETQHFSYMSNKYILPFSCHR